MTAHFWRPYFNCVFISKYPQLLHTVTTITTKCTQVFIIISVKGKGCFCGMKYFAHQNEKQQHTNATQHEAVSTAKLVAVFFYFLFFSFHSILQEGCLHWNATGFELFQMK